MDGNIIVITDYDTLGWLENVKFIPSCSQRFKKNYLNNQTDQESENYFLPGDKWFGKMRL